MHACNACRGRCGDCGYTYHIFDFHLAILLLPAMLRCLSTRARVCALPGGRFGIHIWNHSPHFDRPSIEMTTMRHAHYKGHSGAVDLSALCDIVELGDAKFVPFKM
jgi:hypothetical protein